MTISRVMDSLTFRGNFMLVAATPALRRTQCGASVNPCHCGYHGDPVKECTCSLTQVLRCQERISGPLLDRIDIHVELPPVDYEKLAGDRLRETSERIRERAAMRPRSSEIPEAMRRGGTEGIARAVADLAASDKIETPRWGSRGSVRPARFGGTPHLAEAIQYLPRRQA